MSNKYDRQPLPLKKEGDLEFITGMQVTMDPHLAAYVKDHKDEFELPHDRDIYIWKGKKKG